MAASLGAVVLVIGALAVVAVLVLRGRAEPRAGSLPPARRHVPRYDATLLDGCSTEDRQLVVEGIDGAIRVGAPLYNGGDFAGCYHLYDGTASDLERRLSSSCEGPRRALAAGQTRAAALASPSDQAWAMRDAFDGVLLVAQPGAAP